MNQKFTLLLLGPAGSGKSAFISGLSEFDIFEHITAKTQGGANTTKISTTYEFSSIDTQFKVISCTATEKDTQENLLRDLQSLSLTENGFIDVFKRINDDDFCKKCSSITIQLPCKKNIIPKNNLFNTVVVKDSRGFGDVDDSGIINIDDLGITYDVNAILFFSISAIQQPAIFSKIIENVIKFNLKTPMFLLRRDQDLTKNDIGFEENIKSNISNTDKQLSGVIGNIAKSDNKYRISDLIFNIPEVRLWKGALYVDSSTTQKEIDEYNVAVKEVLTYSIAMYDELYRVILEKMQGEYQNLFIEKVINRLLSEDAFQIISDIVDHPSVKPGRNYYVFRDTAALAYPVNLYNVNCIGEAPFSNEKSARGNMYQDGVIPSYSYACVNFRNIFRKIVGKLISVDVSNYQLVPLLNTFLEIVLKDHTITAFTGYTFEDCAKDAFKFDVFVESRNSCTTILSKNNLIDDESNWKPFSYTPINRKYEDNKAIAVLIYKHLIESLDLSAKYQKYQKTTLQEEGKNFIEEYKKHDILKQVNRS